MNKEYTIRLIQEYNPQLIGKAVEIPIFKRDLYLEISKWIDKKQIIAITGLRRVGKTVIMKQLMQNIEKPAFFSFDEEETQTKETLLFIIDYFLNVMKSKYIFLDEIHYIKDWQGVLKRYYDTRNVKLVISGSESLEITKAKESLAGRIVTFKLETLSFKEYLLLKGHKIEIKKEIKEIYEGMLSEKEFYESEFLNYLYNGAFPEIINEKEDEIIRKYLNELVVKKIIYRDLPRVFEIKRRDLLFDLFRYICDHSSDLYEIKNLCSLFNADYGTITNYLFYLEKSYLIKIAEIYSKNISKGIKKRKKVYVVHPSLAFSVMGYNKEMLVEKILGQYVESLFGDKFFWRDDYGNEVDVIVKNKPVEIKYRNNIERDDLKGVLRFLDIFKLNEGWIVSKDRFGEEMIGNKKINFVPAWLFSLYASIIVR